MTIPKTPFDPADYGLPGEAEIASWAAEWFPEFNPDLNRGGVSPPGPPGVGAPPPPRGPPPPPPPPPGARAPRNCPAWKIPRSARSAFW
jgi:hypothetical protein